MDVFVYGSLTEPEQVGRVVDSYAFLGPAVLSGLHPVQGELPTLAPGGETGGRLLRTDEVDALDSYEGGSSPDQKPPISDGVDDGLYVRVSVPLEAEEGNDDTVEVYVGDPSRLGIAAPDGWPGDRKTDPFAERVDRYLREHEVRVYHRRG